MTTDITSMLFEHREPTSTTTALQKSNYGDSQVSTHDTWVPKSWFTDPFALLDSLGLGYKSSPSGLSYETLKQMADHNVIIAAIIQTRIHQVASFCRPQQNKYSIGFRISHRDSPRRLTESEINFIRSLEDFIMQTGVDYSIDRDDFPTYIKKLVRDALIYDQIVTEIVSKNSGKPHSFLAVPGSTIRIASPKNRKGTPFNPKESEVEIKYCQIVDGVIVNTYTPKELAFSVANPRSDLRGWGYGYSVLEMLIKTITAHLWAEDWNRRSFCVFKDLAVITNTGLQTIESVYNTSLEQQTKEDIIATKKSTIKLVNGDRIWTGTDWSPYKVYKTGEKELCETTLEGQYTIKTSPDHRFKVVPKCSITGLPEWRTQSELHVGDYVLMNATAVELSCVDTSFSVKGNNARGKDFEIKSAGSDLWEVLGWWLGDGGISRGINDIFHLYYRRTSEEKYADRHEVILQKYGLQPKKYTKPLTGVTAKCGGNTGPILDVCQNTFVEYLEYLGFIESGTTNKHVPKILFSETIENRCAFLRGYFSADGCAPKKGDGNLLVSMKSPYKKSWIKPIQQLLMTLGIRARWKLSSGHLVISDTQKFNDMVGFLQDYKCNRSVISKKLSSCSERLHPVLCKRIAAHIQNSALFSTLDRQTRKIVQAVVVGRHKISAGKLRSILVAVNLNTYDEILSYYQMKIVSVKNTKKLVEMYDVAVFDEVHQFIGDGIVLHNSQGSTTKGILNLKGNIPPQQLDSFKRQWVTQVSGVSNSWRTPIINSNDDLQWISLQPTNTEMGYKEWMDYLIKCACACYLIDPAEINFDMRAGMGQKPMFMSTNEAQQKVSQDRGLRPLLHHVEDHLNRYIVRRIDPNYKFEFVGIDAKTESEAIELRLKELQSYKTLNEIREVEQLPPVPHGDVVPNPSYIGYRNQKEMMAAHQGGQSGAGGAGGIQGLPPTEPSKASEDLGQRIIGTESERVKHERKPDRFYSPDEEWETTYNAAVESDLQKALEPFDEFIDY